MYAGRCYGYFYRLTGDRNRSDELLSELFVKLVEKIKGYRGGSFDSWIFRIATNVFHDELRSKQRQQRVLEERGRRIEAEQAGRPQEPDFDRMQQQLARLDEDVRELIMLRYYSQVSFKEIAAMRGEPIGTVLSKVHRGLKKLRELME